MAELVTGKTLQSDLGGELVYLLADGLIAQELFSVGSREQGTVPVVADVRLHHLSQDRGNGNISAVVGSRAGSDGIETSV